MQGKFSSEIYEEKQEYYMILLLYSCVVALNLTNNYLFYYNLYYIIQDADLQFLFVLPSANSET